MSKINTRDYIYHLPFHSAAKSTHRALRKKWGLRVEVPALSHALSNLDDNGNWLVKDVADLPVARVSDSGNVELIDPAEIPQ